VSVFLAKNRDDQFGNRHVRGDQDEEELAFGKRGPDAQGGHPKFAPPFILAGVPQRPQLRPAMMPSRFANG